MKTILKLILSAIILFGAVPTVNAMDMKMDNMEEIKKKKKKKKKIGGAKRKEEEKSIFLESICVQSK